MYLIVGVLIGMFFPIQASFGTKLNSGSKNKMIGSFIAFSVGSIILVFLNLLINVSFYQNISLLKDVPLLYLLGGGVVGILYNVSAMNLYKVIGAYYTTIFTFVGQVLMGLMIDGFGLFSVAKRQISIFNYLGIIVMVIAVVISKKKQESQHNKALLLSLLAVVAGILPPLQQVFNRNLSAYTSGPLGATLISFLVGTLIILVIILVKYKEIKIPIKDQNDEKIPKYFYFGGIFGILILTGNIVVLPHIGSTITIFTGMLGQMMMALLIDYYGVFGLRKQKIENRKLYSLLLMIVGILLVNA